jgi:hypothetical protein
LEPKEWYADEEFGKGEAFRALAVPSMFAFRKRDISGNKAAIKICDSKWSKVRIECKNTYYLNQILVLINILF